MSNNCRNSDLLQRDGTSRQQRLLKALLPDYVAVDERKIDDLKTFVVKFAKEITYYNHKNEPDGDWEMFFQKKLDPRKRTEPHYALFLAFLQLFKIAQDDLNQITRKHLDFYYRDVLQMKEKEPAPDQVFMIFKLAKHVDKHLLKKGTQLKAGKDDLGNELTYKTNREIVLNKGTVHQIKAVFKDLDSSRIYISPVANSVDGLGAEIESAEGNWRTFGKPEGEWTAEQRPDRPQAEIGFAFASPLLFLAEGDREVTITLSLNEDMPAALDEDLKKLKLQKAFRVRFSGDEDWIEPLIEENEIEKGKEFPPGVEKSILDYLNRAESWQDIADVKPQAGPVFMNLKKGYGGQAKHPFLSKANAREIYKIRDAIGEKGFTKLDQVRAIKGVVEDKINYMVHKFTDNSTIVDSANKQIIIKRTITKAQDPIVTYIQNGKTLLAPFVTDWPVVKITLHTDQDPYLYETLQKFALKSVNISVNVSEVRELIIQNDQSILDPSKDFQPFGIRPELGSNFYIGNREVFSKQLDMLKIKLLWHGLPEDPNGFEDYYKNYITEGRSNESFKADISLLDKKSWVKLAVGDDAMSLFANGDSEPLQESQVLTIEDVDDIQKVTRDVHLPDFDSYDTTSRKGFLKLKLAGTDFGHKDYQPSYTRQILGAFVSTTDVTTTEETKDVPQVAEESFTINPKQPMPNEPYTPLLKEISISYKSSVDLDLNISQTADELSNRIEQFYHVGAFGVAEQQTSQTEPPFTLLPQYTDEGSLYIGVQDFKGGQSLSLLFQVAEGSADPGFEPQTVHWSYLSGNRWVDFDKFDILSDSTTGLLTSGIINFDVSKQATDQNTLLPSGLHWLRATVKKESDAVSDLIKVMAQAVPATFKDQDNDPDHLKDALSAETISKLKVAESAIAEIFQPFASFGGKVKEQKSAFYTRVSEQLRHKNRAITVWDYERLVLEQFPSVHKVKCLNHTRHTGRIDNYSELAPGHVTLIVISNVRNKNAVDPLRPKTSLITLTDITDFISELNSVCVDLHVKNPIYEDIKVTLKVKFYQGLDNGFYGKKLEDDLKAFLSPWAFEATSELLFGGKIHKSVILNYVEERSYVDFVTCFEMYHIIKNPSTDKEVSRQKVNEAIASTAVSILGSVGQIGRYGDHGITVLEGEECECDDNEVKPTSSIASVDDCPCDEDQMFET